METMTVAELIEKLKRLPKSAPVFMLTDRSDDNWDEDKACYKRVHGIAYVDKEIIYNETGFGEDQFSILLQIEC